MAHAVAAIPPTSREIRPDDQDLHLVRSAIDLIAAGGARRVTLVGIRGAERLLPRAQALSAEAGLSARGIWQPDGLSCDIAVEDVR
jgi:hypothetical protein